MVPIFPIETLEQIAVMVVSVIFAVLPVIAVSLRVLSRRKLGRKLDLSDGLMIFSCVSFGGAGLSKQYRAK